MPRPTLPQLCTGTFTVVASAVALLAVSGATSVFEVVVLMVFAVTLGSLATALLMTLSSQRQLARATRSGARVASAAAGAGAGAGSAGVPGPRPEYAGR
ncbi:hypothetical protein [Kitasatospora sp. NBC_01539]|uniref:hypothetical protein n=1 Tax=Kitasatospora sp. NBC_01539 TaxID=2903577 RepID=UPI0038602BBC